VIAHPLAGVTGRRDKTCVSSEPVSTLEGADVAHGHQKLGPEEIGPMPGKLVRIRASGRAKKRFLSSSSMLSMCSLRARISLCGELCNDARNYLLLCG
jgi:hypothetical protein